VKDIVPVLEKAFAVAQSGVPGPVFVELPIDVLYPEKFIRKEAMGKFKGTSFVETVTKWYIGRHLDNLYGGKQNAVALKLQRPAFATASAGQIASALSMITDAHKPVLVLGSQTVLRSEQVFQVQKAVEQLGLPVYLSGMARGLMGKSHPLQLRHKRGNALKEADLVILIGVPFDFRLDYGQGFSAATKTLCVNLDKTDLSKNRSPSLAILADPTNFLLRLAAAATKAGSSNRPNLATWLAKLKARDADRDTEILKMAEEPTDRHLNPLKVCLGVEKALTDKAILVADGGDFVATTSYIVRPPNPLAWLDPGVFGTLGVGAGFALGAKLCRPESDVWLIWGDGSAGYSIMEYDTFVRHNVPVIAVVGNDACWTQIYREQVVMFKDDSGCMLAFNDYDKVVEALGAKGILLNQADKIDSTFVQAREIASGPNARPVLVNALLGKTDFRKGSISM